MSQPRKLHDQYFKKAKAEGYLARSAYKLLEIQERHRLIRRGDRVLDLGCAPGSWLQVAEKIVGERGVVVGVDLTAVTHRFPPHVHHFVGDVFKTSAAELLGVEDEAGEPGPISAQGASEAHETPTTRSVVVPSLDSAPRFDIVLSDMAPSTTGHGDDFLSVRLCRRILELLPNVVRPGGGLVMKVLEGEEFPQLLNETRAVFAKVKGFKPKASRDVSREMFIVAEGWRGGSQMANGKSQMANQSAKPRPALWSTPPPA